MPRRMGSKVKLGTPGGSSSTVSDFAVVSPYQVAIFDLDRRHEIEVGRILDPRDVDRTSGSFCFPAPPWPAVITATPPPVTMTAQPGRRRTCPAFRQVTVTSDRFTSVGNGTLYPVSPSAVEQPAYDCSSSRSMP